MQDQLRAALVDKDSDKLRRLFDRLDSNIEFQLYLKKGSLTHHVASQAVSLQCLRLLVDKFGPACLTCRNETGETPVHLAARYKDDSWMELIRNLLDRECFGLKANWGGTAAHYAAANEVSNASLRWLAKELEIGCLTCPDRDGNTAVHLTAKYQSADSLQFLADQLGSGMFCLANNKGETLADWAEKETNGNRKFSKQAWMASQPAVFQHQPAMASPVSPYRERWDTVRLIGRGGFGEVHEVHTDKGIRCAAKTLRLPVQLGAQMDSISRVVDRAVESERNLCLLEHENIVRFLYITQTEPATVVLFMEMLDGCTLETFLNEKPLDEVIIREFSKQICSALLYMHSRQTPVIHRDINCSNISVLSDNRRIKLIDFGLSIKLEQSVSHITGSSATPRGTVNFMAPELLASDEIENPKYSRESDTWAFGCSVFQMASGNRPYAEYKNAFTLPERLRNSGAPAMSNGCSAELRDFYRRCTAKDRKKRKSANELSMHAFLTAGKLEKRNKFGVRFSNRK